MNVIRLHTRDTSIHERPGSMTALDRLKVKESKDGIQLSIHNIGTLFANNPGPITGIFFQALLILLIILEL